MRLRQLPFGAAIGASAGHCISSTTTTTTTFARHPPIGARFGHAAALHSSFDSDADPASSSASTTLQAPDESESTASPAAARLDRINDPRSAQDSSAAGRRGYIYKGQKVDPRLGFLVQYNIHADELIRMCSKDRQIYRYTPRKLQLTLLAFGQAQQRAQAQLALPRPMSSEASSSRVTLRVLAQNERILADELLTKLNKRLRVLIFRFCHQKRDADIDAYIPRSADESESFGFRDIRLYNTMLNISLGYLGDIQLFRNVMFALKRRTIPPNNITLTILLQHAAKRKDTALAADVVRLGLKLADLFGQDTAGAWSAWRQGNADSAAQAQSAVDGWLEDAGRAVKTQLQQHPICRLLTYSIRCVDSHLMLALIEIADVFELAARPSGPSREPEPGCPARPWPQIKMATLFFYLYPFLRRGQIPTIAADTRVRNRSITSADPRLRNRSRARLRLSHHPDWGRARDLALLPQHTPAVLTAALTALVHEGRFSRVHRLWDWMKRLSALSSKQAASPATSELERAGQTGDQVDGGAVWQIPVRAATVYLTAITTYIRRETLREKIAASASSRASDITISSPVGLGISTFSTTGSLAARARANDARQAVMRCYLSLRQHWRLDIPAPAKEQQPRAKQKRNTHPIKATGKPKTKRPGHREKPDRYFYAVLLNSLVPRHDGPLAFVDWRMAMIRLRKRFPDLVEQASASQGGRRKITTDREDKTSKLSLRPVKHDETVEQDTHHTRGTGAKHGRLRWGRRQYIAGLPSGGKDDLVQTLQLVLSDMQAVGIEATR
ncbi:hypothetical protein V8E36_004181 [Tilletia maclaganii]